MHHVMTHLTGLDLALALALLLSYLMSRSPETKASGRPSAPEKVK